MLVLAEGRGRWAVSQKRMLWSVNPPIRYVAFHFRDRRGAASLRHKNRAATTVLVCDLTPYIRCDFRGRSKATIRYSLNTP